MSASTPNTPNASNGSLSDVKAGIETWAPLVIAVWTQVLLAAALVMAILHLFSESALMLLLGVVATNATSGVQFYFGSSSGSKRKDEQIAQQSAQLANSIPNNVVPLVRSAAP